jgi:hypothetical protein
LVDEHGWSGCQNSLLELLERPVGSLVDGLGSTGKVESLDTTGGLKNVRKTDDGADIPVSFHAPSVSATTPKRKEEGDERWDQRTPRVLAALLATVVLAAWLARREKDLFAT